MNKATSWSVKSSFEKAIKTDKFLVSVSKKKKDVTFLKKKKIKEDERTQPETTNKPIYNFVTVNLKCTLNRGLARK